MVWTRFMDMHSGGEEKLPWAKIIVEMPEDEARDWFQREFGRAPDHVTCGCCGEDYSVYEEETLAEITGHDRHCRYDEDQDTYVEEQEPRYIRIRQDCGTERTDSWGLYQTLDELIATGKLNETRAEDVLIVSKDGPLTPNWPAKTPA